MAPNPPPSKPFSPGPYGGRMGPDEIPPADMQDSWKDVTSSILERLGEIREYAGYYVSTQTDAIKNKVTWLVVYAVLGIVGAIIGTAALATIGVLLINGIAGGLAALFGGRVWLGQLVTAVLLLGLIGIGAFVGMKMLRSSLKRKLMAKYEQRHQDQRKRYGSDVLQRAAERQEQQAVG